MLCSLTDKDLRRICGSQYEHPGSAIGYWPETCLGHIYIVLEPVGSARLTFDDDLYYELCDLMTEVCLESRMRSQTCEESRNGRDVKIDILEGYIRTSERFRVIRLFFGVPENYENSPGEVLGLHGPSSGREEAAAREAPPQAQTELD